MKNLSWLLALVLQIGWLPSDAQKTINDPNVQVRSVGGFSAVSVSSSIDLFISQSSSEAVAVSASDPKYRDMISTEVRNGTLYIEYKSKGKDWGAKEMRAYVSVVNINKLSASGACDIHIEGELKASDLEIKISGSSDFKGRVTAQNLKLTGSGSSDFIISGRTNNLRIDVSGASDLKGFDLVAENCDAEASGASDISITVNKELNVKASGASDITYKGSGYVKNSSTSGASDIKKKG